MRIESISFKPEDIIVIQFPYDKYNCGSIKQIAESVHNIFNENKILFLPEDLTLSVFSRENDFI